MNNLNKQSSAGFTLIEVMIIVVIVGILAAIAWPSYQNFLRQTRLERARADLLTNAQMMERFYSQCHTFTPASGAQAPCNVAAPALTTSDEVSRFFTIRYGANNPGANNYELVAAPLANTGETRELRYDSTNSMTLCEPGAVAASDVCRVY